MAVTAVRQLTDLTAGMRGLKTRLVQRDRYRASSVLGPLNELRVLALRTGRRLTGRAS